MPWKKLLLEGDAAVLSDTVPEDAKVQTANAGVATEASRRDHKHNITTGIPGDISIGDSADAGASANLAKADHKHGSPATWTPSSHALDTHAVPSANIDFNDKEGVKFALESQASNPSTTKVGRTIFNTADGHPYVYTA